MACTLQQRPRMKLYTSKRLVVACVSATLLSACIVHKHYAAPAASTPGTASSAAAPAIAPPPMSAQAPIPTLPTPAPEPPPLTAPQPPPPAATEPAPPPPPGIDDASEYAARYAVAKAALRNILATDGQFAVSRFHLRDVGFGEPAPVVEAPGGGFYLAINRNARDSMQVPSLLRLDATGSVTWERRLPVQRPFDTYEVRGALVAPDGDILVIYCPFVAKGASPRPHILTKVDPNGRVHWTKQLPAKREFMRGPFIENASIDASGNVIAWGHATRHDEGVRDDFTGTRYWYGTITRDGNVVRSELGDLMPQFLAAPRALHPFWNDLTPLR